MTGYRSKKAMSDSRFAVLYEDPDYEESNELTEGVDAENWDELEADDFNPFNSINS